MYSQANYNDRADASLILSRRKEALQLAVGFAAVKLLLQFVLTLWTLHLGYGYFRDEFYYLACGRHLAWGYVDHGPLVAVQARLATLLFGDSVFGIRVFAALAGALAVGLCGLLTWALGGTRSAQVLSMLGLLVAPVYLGVDSCLSMTPLEPVFWMACVLLLILMQRSMLGLRSWTAIGLLSGVGLLNKPSMLFFLLPLLLALLCTPERRLLRTPWFAAAVVLTLLLIAPYLAWQMHHGWPTWEFLRNGKLQAKNKLLGPPAFVWAQIGQTQPVNLLLWLLGLVALFHLQRLRPFRWIGLTFSLFFVLMLALHAKDYYLAPAYPMLFAAGGVAWQQWFPRPPDRLLAFPILEAALVFTGLLILPLASPVLPPQTWARYTHTLHLAPNETENSRTSILPQFFADRFGWDQLTDIVVDGYRVLPAAEQQHTCIIANNYGEAAALEFLGRRREPALPPVLSGHNNYWLWGMHGCSGNEFIAVVHDTPEELRQRYNSVTILGHTSDPLAMSFEHKNIYLLRDPKTPNPIQWPDEKNYI